MTCDEARERLSALLDDALGPADRSALDAHVATCVDCRRELGLLRNTVALLRAVEPARAPAGFADRVRAAAQPLPWWRRLVRAVFLPWPVRVSLGATAVVLVSVVVAAILRATAPELEREARIEPPSPAVVTEAPPAEPGALARRDVKPAPAPAARAQREERAASLADDKTDAARRRDLAKAAPSPAPAAAPPVEGKAGAESVDATRSRLALRSAVADVAGRLAVRDREAAARAIVSLAAKAGGAEVARRTTTDATVVELTLPGSAWAELARELAALGSWTPEREPAELPAEIRVTLRITE